MSENHEEDGSSSEKSLKFIFSKRQFLHHNPEKVREYFERLSKVKSDDDAFDFFRYKTSQINVHHKNLHPIDKMEFLTMFELFEKLIMRFNAQLVEAQKIEDAVKYEEIEEKLIDLIRHYSWLLLVGKNRWAEVIVSRNYLDELCEKMVDLMNLSCNPKLLFEIYKAIPINELEVESRNNFIVGLSYYSDSVDEMRGDFFRLFHSELSISFGKNSENVKSIEERVKILLSDEHMKSHSSASINLEINSLLGTLFLKDILQLFHYIVHFIHIVLIEKDAGKKALDFRLLNLLGLLTQIYYQDKIKNRDDYRILKYLKLRQEGPELLYKRIEEFIDTYAEKDDNSIHHMLDFLVNMDYPALFSADEFQEFYLSSSLFYKLESYFFDVLKDIFDHLNSGGEQPTKFRLSSIGLSNVMNLKDVIEVSLQQVEAMKFLIKKFKSSSSSSSSSSSDHNKDLSRDQVVSLYSKGISLNQQILLSFFKSEWIFDAAILEVYLAFAAQTFPDFQRIEIRDQLKISIVESLKGYLQTGNAPLKRFEQEAYFSGSIKAVTPQEYYFAMKSLLTIVKDFSDDESFEVYLNDIFFNVNHFANLCVKAQEGSDMYVRCRLLNLCLKCSNIEQIENHFNWKSDNKLKRFEDAMDLFVSESMKLDSYFESFITCCTEKIAKAGARNRYIRMIVKYSFLRIYYSLQSSFELSIDDASFNEAYRELQKQCKAQEKSITKESELLKECFRMYDITSVVPKNLRFLYTNIVNYIDKRSLIQHKNFFDLLQAIDFKSTNDAWHRQSLFFSLMHEHSLLVGQNISYMKEKLQPTSTLIGVSAEFQALVYSLEVEKNVLEILSSPENSLRISRYFISKSGSKYYMLGLSDEVERAYHQQSVKLIILLNYFSQHRDKQYDEQMFSALIELTINIFNEFMKMESTLKNPDRFVKIKKNIFVHSYANLNKLSICLVFLQKELLAAGKDSFVNQHLLRVAEFCVSCYEPFEKPEENVEPVLRIESYLQQLIQSVVLIPKVFDTIGVMFENKIGNSMDVRFIFLTLSLNKDQSKVLIDRHFKYLKATQNEIAEFFSISRKGEACTPAIAKILDCIETISNYPSSSSILAFSLVRYYAEFKEANSDNLIELVNELIPIAEMENRISNAIRENSTKSMLFGSKNRFTYLLSFLRTDFSGYKKVAAWVHEAVFEDIPRFIGEERDIEGVIQILIVLSEKHSSVGESSLLMNIVESLECIEEEVSTEDCFRLYFMYVMYAQAKDTEASKRIAKKLERLIFNATSQLSDNCYRIVFLSPDLTEDLKECMEQKNFLIGLTLYERIKPVLLELREGKAVINNLIHVIGANIDFEVEESKLDYFIDELLESRSLKEDVNQIIAPISRVFKNSESSKFVTNAITVKLFLYHSIIEKQQDKLSSFRLSGEFDVNKMIESYLGLLDLFDLKEYDPCLNEMIDQKQTVNALKEQIEKKNEEIFSIESCPKAFIQIARKLIKSDNYLAILMCDFFPQLVVIESEHYERIITESLNQPDKKLFQAILMVVSEVGSAELIDKYYKLILDMYNSLEDEVEKFTLLSMILPDSQKERVKVTQLIVNRLDFKSDDSKNYYWSQKMRSQVETLKQAQNHQGFFGISMNQSKMNTKLLSLLENEQSYKEFYSEYQNRLAEINQVDSISAFKSEQAFSAAFLDRGFNFYTFSPSYQQIKSIESRSKKMEEKSRLLQKKQLNNTEDQSKKQLVFELPLLYNKEEQQSIQDQNKDVPKSSEESLAAVAEEKENEDDWDDADDDEDDDNDDDSDGAEHQQVEVTEEKKNETIPEESKKIEKELEQPEEENEEDWGDEEDEDEIEEGESDKSSDKNKVKPQIHKGTNIVQEEVNKNSSDKQNESVNDSSDYDHDLEQVEGVLGNIDPVSNEKKDLAKDEDNTCAKQNKSEEEDGDDDDDDDNQDEDEEENSDENDDDQENSDEGSEEDEEVLQENKKEWQAYLQIKEEWSALCFFGGSEKEKQTVKDKLFKYINLIKGNKEKKEIVQDIFKQTDDAELKKFLAAKFPKNTGFSHQEIKNKRMAKIESAPINPDDNDEQEEEEDLDDSIGLLHISSSEGEQFDDESEDGDEDDDEYDRRDGNRRHQFDEYVDEEFQFAPESVQQTDTWFKSESPSASEQKDSGVDKALIALYLDSQVYYPEEMIENILKQFYMGEFRETCIDKEYLNPVNGPQLMGALFFLITQPRLDEIAGESEYAFMKDLGKGEIFLQNFFTFYENTMRIFKFICEKKPDVIHYFTLDASHWSYLPQLPFIKRLKDKIGHKDLSGLRILLRLTSQSHIQCDEIPNNDHIDSIELIMRKITSVQIEYTPNDNELKPRSIHKPIVTKNEVESIIRYHQKNRLPLSEHLFLEAIIKEVSKNLPNCLEMIEMLIDIHCTLLKRDVIGIMNVGIEDAREILNSNKNNSRRLAISHLSDMFTDSDLNPLYDCFKQFGINLRAIMRIYFKAVKQQVEEQQQQEHLQKLRDVLSHQSLLQLFQQILKQLSFIQQNLFNSQISGTAILTEEDAELASIIASYSSIVKLMYMLHPYYDLTSNPNPVDHQQNKDSQIEFDQLPELPPIGLLHQSSTAYDHSSQALNKILDQVCEPSHVMKIDELRKVLESGFCQIIKLFVGMDNQLFQKYVKVVSKDPQNLKQLDLETRVMTILVKAIRIADRVYEDDGTFIELRIDRKCVFEDSFRVIMRLKPMLLVQKQFDVAFRKEDGIDQNGLTREWYSCISKELFSPRNGLFRITAKKHFIVPSSTSYIVPDHLSIFKFTGIITAKSILDGYLIGINLPTFFLKHLTCTPLKLSDMDDFDPELTKNLMWMLDNSVEGLQITFIYEYEEFGNKKTEQLIANGANELVTDQNKKEYVNLVMEFVMIKQLQAQTLAFIDGFFKVFPRSELNLIDWMELGIKIAGAQDIDLKELRANTIYTGGYSELTPCIQWFWEILFDFDEKMKRKFLFFLSGSYKVPQGGYKDMGFTICQVYEIQQLPVAHTCFNKLDIPSYEDRETLEKKLFQAILEGNEGFGIA